MVKNDRLNSLLLTVKALKNAMADFESELAAYLNLPGQGGIGGLDEEARERYQDEGKPKP